MHLTSQPSKVATAAYEGAFSWRAYAPSGDGFGGAIFDAPASVVEDRPVAAKPGQPRIPPDVADGHALSWTELLHLAAEARGLTAHQRQIVVLRTCHYWGSPQGWEQNAAAAKALGVSDARIAAARSSRLEADSPDVDLLRATDAVLSNGQIEDHDLRTVGRSLDDAGLFDLMQTVGVTSAAAFIANSFERSL